MLMWKNLGASKVSVLYIYIYRERERERLVANLHIAHNNFFKVVSLNLFFAIWILDYNLTKSSVFYNYIFILSYVLAQKNNYIFNYYRNNKKCNIHTYIHI